MEIPNPGQPGSLRLTGFMEIFVRIFGRDRVSVKIPVKASDTIRLVKSTIYEKTGIPPHHQRLIRGVHGEQLEDSCPLFSA